MSQTSQATQCKGCGSLPGTSGNAETAVLLDRHGKDDSRVIVGVPKETYPGERRVALVPAVVPNLVKAGLEVIVETGAGVEAGYPDADFAAKGAKILPERAEVFRAADIL